MLIKNVPFIRLYEHSKLPAYAKPRDACMDVFSAEEHVLEQFVVHQVGTGISAKIPEGYKILIYPKSGISNSGVIVLNAPGTVEEDYEGELKVLLMNLVPTPYIIKVGQKVAQLSLDKVIKVLPVDVVGGNRGAAGFGSTGLF